MAISGEMMRPGLRAPLEKLLHLLRIERRRRVHAVATVNSPRCENKKREGRG